MAINKLMKAALKALSYPDINLKKNYKLERTFMNVKGYHPIKPSYNVWDHSVFYQDHKIPVRIFSPVLGKNPSEEIVDEHNWNNTKEYPILLFFHGGGWVAGNIDSYNRVCLNLATQIKHLVVSVDYRLAPEHPFPAGLEDCYAVAKEIFQKTDLLHSKPEYITLIGDSAGGNLAAAVSLMARDRGDFEPKRQVLIYPATYNDHGDTSPFASIQENGSDYLLTSKMLQDYMELYMGNQNDWENPYFAPLLAKDFSRQPDTLILTAEYDPLRDEGEAYGEKLRQAGNQVEIIRISDALHGFISLPLKFQQVKESMELIQQFIQKHSEPNLPIT